MSRLFFHIEMYSLPHYFKMLKSFQLAHYTIKYLTSSQKEIIWLSFIFLHYKGICQKGFERERETIQRAGFSTGLLLALLLLRI